jgi:hypothetical protein
MKITFDQLSELIGLLNDNQKHVLHLSKDGFDFIYNLVTDGDGADFEMSEYRKGFMSGVSSMLGDNLDTSLFVIRGKKILITKPKV